jgi:perosamine synthetase
VKQADATPSIRIPLSRPACIGNERRYLLDCLAKQEFSWVGEYVGRFEKAFAEFCGVRHAIACSSGTAALHLSLLALDLKPHQAVLLPALTYVATANAVAYCGGTPVFVDVDPYSWCMDPTDLEMKLAMCNDRPVAILPVHLYGMPANMQEIRRLAEIYGASVVEDAAEAHGAKYRDAVVGSIGDLGCFSFYGNKIMTTGEGGMVTTDSDALASRVKRYRGQGQSTRRYWHDVIGYNYRLTNLQAALGLGQLEDFWKHALSREKVASVYEDLLPPFLARQLASQTVTPATWLFTVLVPKGVDRDVVIQKLANQGIETRPVFIPLTQLPMYQRTTPPVSLDISARGISLPTHGWMSRAHIEEVVSSLIQAVEES